MEPKVTPQPKEEKDYVPERRPCYTNCGGKLLMEEQGQGGWKCTRCGAHVSEEAF